MKNILSDFGKLALGGAGIAGASGGYAFGDVKEAEAIALLQYAFERGVRVFDSAPIYGFGESEKRIGKAFKSLRERVFITSKSGVTWDSNRRVDMSNAADVTQKMLEQSLRDLDTDYIDLFMIHWPDQNVDIRRPIEVLAKAKLEGKIRSIGLCNTNLEDLEASLEIEKIEVVQSELNAFNTSNTSLFPFLEKENIAFQSWGTLDKGILTGRVSKKREQGKSYDQADCRKSAPWWNQAEVIEKALKVETFQKKLGLSDAELLEWSVGHNLVIHKIDQVLTGPKSIEDLDQTLAAIESLKKDRIEEFRDVWNAI